MCQVTQNLMERTQFSKNLEKVTRFILLKTNSTLLIVVETFQNSLESCISRELIAIILTGKYNLLVSIHYGVQSPSQNCLNIPQGSPCIRTLGSGFCRL